MLNDTPNVMTELAPKGPRFVEIIETMDRPDIPFYPMNFELEEPLFELKIVQMLSVTAL